MPPISSEPSTISTGAESPTSSLSTRVGDGERRQRRDQQRDQAERVGDHVAGALRQPVAEQDADPGSDQHGGHIDDGAEAAKHTVNRRFPRVCGACGRVLTGST